jgi:hypothetical protein
MFLPVVTAAQTPNDNRLVALFADIKQSGGVSPEIQKALQGVMESIPSMAIEQVRSAIPAIAAALSAGDEQVQAIAAAACYAVIRRPDGTELLERELPAVASLFRSPSHRVGYLAGLTLSNAKGKLDPDVMSPVVAAINQRSRSAAERIPALATAVAVAPTDSAVIDAVTAFMLEPLDASTKADALTAIRTSRIDVPAIRLELISWLQDSDARVKLGTISVLTRMGPEAVDWARLELQRITERASEQNDVRGAAAKALQMLR